MSSDDSYDLKLATALLERGLAEQAYRVGTKYQKQFPDDARVISLLGDILFRMQNYSKAEAHFSQALEMSQPTPKLLVARARCRLALGQDDGAAADVANAIEIYSLHPGALEIAAELTLKWGRSEVHRPGRGWALVTGAAQGIGFSAVQKLAALGFDCLALDCDRNALETSAKLWSGATVKTAIADVAKREEVRAAVATVPSLEVVVNNAAIYAEAPLEAISEAAFGGMMSVNLMGSFIVTQEVLAKMNRGGRIIVVGSIGAGDVHGSKNIAHYLASKAALAGLWGASIVELGERGISTHMVKPGFIDTRMQRQGDPERHVQARENRAMTPPSLVADAIASFAVRHRAIPFVTGMVARIA